jgi:hypothetical protein
MADLRCVRSVPITPNLLRCTMNPSSRHYAIGIDEDAAERRIAGHRPYRLALAEAQRAHASTPLLRDRILSAVRIPA